MSGTTNRDEGAYIGFFGKASDGMVDLQPIADIHKSEVYAIAKILNIPEYIINASPKGDVWNNKLDVEMIGAPYDIVEVFILLLNMGIQPTSIIIKDVDENNLYQQYVQNIESFVKEC